MSCMDNYLELKSKEKVDLFTELFELKEKKAELDKRIKELEKGYKEEIALHNEDVFYILPNRIRFSIKSSERTGGYDTKAMIEDGLNIERYRKASTIIFTLRRDKD